MWDDKFRPNYLPARGYLLHHSSKIRDLSKDDRQPYFKAWEKAIKGAVLFSEINAIAENTSHASFRYFRIRKDHNVDAPTIFVLCSKAINKGALAGLVARVKPPTGDEFLPKQVGCTVLDANADLIGLTLLSTNPLGLYSTWIKTTDLDNYIKLQVGGDDSWIQRFPTYEEVENFNKGIIQAGGKALILPEKEGGLVQHTSGTVLDMKAYPSRTKLLAEGRMETEKIMGDSANKVPCSQISCLDITLNLTFSFFSGQRTISNGQLPPKEPSEPRSKSIQF